MKKNRRLRVLARSAALLALAALGGLPAAARETPGPAARKPVTLAAREVSRVPLRELREIEVLSGEAQEERIKESLAPLSLASADFDEDGVPDLVAGYAMGSQGLLTLWRGNEDSIHPNALGAQRRRESGQFTDSPFLKSERSFGLPAPPEFVVAGDFDGDGHADILFTSRGSLNLNLLSGNGRGGFGALRTRDLPGLVTAMTAGVMDPRGATLGVAVAVVTGRGASLLLFGPEPLLETPEALALPEPATSLALGRLDDDLYPDIAVAAGSDLLLVHGRAGSAEGTETAEPGALAAGRRIERRELPFLVAAVATGSFSAGSREGVALLAEGGRSYLLLPRAEPAIEGRSAEILALSSPHAGRVAPPSAFFPAGTARTSAAPAGRVAGLGAWDLTEAGGEAGDGRVLSTARLTGSAEDDLVVLDRSGGRIHVVSASAAPQGAAAASATEAANARPTFADAGALDTGGKPVAVLPMRLNADAASDLVVLRSGSAAPAVMLTATGLTFTVNSTADTPDASANGVCADINGDCTLRAAIMEANGTAGADTIAFAISGAGVHTITVANQLPLITSAVTIDGTTQPGYAGKPLIELTGPATGQVSGLVIQSSDCVVRGLAVNGFDSGIGIYLLAPGVGSITNEILEANFVGTNAAGTARKPNHVGIGSPNMTLSTIGGTTAAARNLISGNGYMGVQIYGALAVGNIVEGNYVGTDVTGASILFNAEAGVYIFGDNSVVGGDVAGAGNLISGNGDPATNTTEGHGGGIDMGVGCANQACSVLFGYNAVVKGNRIGTNAAGTAAVPNLQHGIRIFYPGAPNATIGSTSVLGRNLISGNGKGGLIGADYLPTTTNVRGNFIGTNAAGTAALGNLYVSPGGTPAGIAWIAGTANTVNIVIGGSSGTTPGGPCTGSCNLISANDPVGILVTGAGLVSVFNNFIGTNAAGTAALGNVQGGVVLNEAPKIVGSSTATGNVISGNGDPALGGFGVLSQNTVSPGVTIKGNLIGTNAAGTAALANHGNGVILGAFDTLGSASDPNVVSGNDGDGVSIPAAASFARVIGNFIGVRSNGGALGNAFGGVTTGAPDGVIQGNQIARNAGNGVTVLGSAVRDSIRGNLIHHNGGLGIDLGGDGVTANDAGDGDTGPNDLMNFPDGLTAIWDGTNTAISGHLDTQNPNTAVVDIFTNSIRDPSGYGQGEVFLGSAIPDSYGRFCLTIAGLPAFSGIPAAGILPQPPWLSATATNALGSTSEFASSVPPPVSLIALEVNQAVQDRKNSVLFIKNKATYVRAHIVTTDPNAGGLPITVQLRGYRNQTELPQSPLTPMNFGIVLARPISAFARGNFKDTANFRLPDSWLDGTVNLRLERTDGSIACNEPADAATPGQCGDCWTTVTFEEGSKFPLKLYRVKWKDASNSFHQWDDAQLDILIQRLVAIYPIAALTDVQRGELFYPGPPNPPMFNDLGKINALLESRRAWDLCFGILCPRLYFGALKDTPSGGLANHIPGTVSSAEAPVNYFLNSRNDHTHEIGHTLGRAHDANFALFGPWVNSWGNPVFKYTTGGCGDVSDNPPVSGTFPYYFPIGGRMVSTLGPMTSGDDAKMFGLDGSISPAPGVVDPQVHLEYMGYCGIKQGTYDWTSDFTYKGLHSAITARFPPSSVVSIARTVAKAAVQDYLVFRGEVDLDAGTAILQPLQRLSTSETPETPPAGDYTLQLRDGVGNVLSETSFQPVSDVPEFSAFSPGPARFLIAVAANPAIRQARILKGANVLASRVASPNPPIIAVTSPNGGENITQDPVLIQWTASDTDGDPLTYVVQYSADGGTSWDALAVDWPDQNLSVERKLLKGTTNGLVRVTASDGFNTAADQSNAVFTVPNHAPRVSIVSPTQGQSYAGNQQIVLEAFSWDLEDGFLTGASLQWTSNVNGSLGSGLTLLKQANQLSPGTHTITVTATDASAASSFASVVITIAAAPPAAFADLTVTQTASPETPTAGSPVIFHLAVSNTGNDAATGVTVTDTLPAGVSFVSAGASQGNCNQASGTVTCALGGLAADAAATITIAVTPPATGSITNTAAATANQLDPVPADNTSSVILRVNPTGPTVSLPPSQAACTGGSAAFSVTASGSGPLTYRWRRNGSDLLDAGDFSGVSTATLTVNPSATADSGSFEVLVTDAFGQTKASGPATLTVNSAPSATIAASAAVCANRAGNRASVPSAGAGATYAWSITNGVITAGAGTSTVAFTSGASGSVSLNVTVTGGCGSPASNGVVLPIGACSAQPQDLAVDPAIDLSDGNGILEPGETVIVRPSWKNPGASPLSLSGTASAFTGPPGAVYTLSDSSAGYGSIGAGATNNCGTTGNCYEVSVSDPAVRPSPHWDAVLTEALSDGDAPWAWPIHVGHSFTDVPTSHTFYSYVERILHKGVTTGCTPTTYCPNDTVFRLQMAIFIARAQAGGDGNVPVSGTAQGNPYNCVSGGTSSFTDIDPTNPFCRHVHYIFSTGVTTGCVPTPPRQYCPGDNVTRGQMALFIGRAVAASDAAVPVTYGPDPVTGRSYSCSAGTPNLHFTDIATGDIYCRHTHYLWAKDVISGFPDGTYGPNLPVSRGAMAKFLANGFNLQLIR